MAKVVEKEQKIRKSKESMIEIASLRKDIESLGWGSYFQNPDPVLEIEAKGKGIKLYDEIARDAHAASVLQTRYLAVIGKEWSVVPAEITKRTGRNPKETQEQKIASFVESVLVGCNFDQMRLELLQGILYGYHGTEIIWKIKNNQIAIDRFYGKHPRRFCFTLEREPRLLTPEAMIEGEEIPDKKFLIFQYGDSDNPYGKGLGQKLWWPVWFKKHGIKFWVVFMEKFGMPTPVGKYPTQAKEQRGKLLEAIGAIRNDTSVVIPDSMTLELMEAARQGDGSYEVACEYFDRSISKVVLGQTLTTEVGSKGSYAASKTHNEVRQDIIEADADLLDAYLNKTLIPWIVNYNFPGVSDYPQLITYSAQKPDLSARSEIDKRLSVEIGLPIAKSYFYETYGIPEPQEGEEIVERAVTQSMFPQQGEEDKEDKEDDGKTPVFAEGKQKYSPEQQAIEGLIDTSVERAKPIFTGIHSQLKKLASECVSLEEFRDKLFAEYSHMSVADLEQLLIEGTIVANLHGRATVQENMNEQEAKYASRK